MRVAFFTDSYAPTHDGVAQVTSGLARELVALGVGVTVFAPHPRVGAAPAEEVDDGVEIVRSRSLPVPYYPQYRWGLFPFSQLRGRRLGSEIDLVHLHSPGIFGSVAFLAARRWRKPLVGTFHTNVAAMQASFPDNVWVRLFFRTAWWYTLGTYWRCDAVTAPTAEAAGVLVAAGKKPFRRPVEVVPNGIEVGRFRPGADVPDWRARCGLPDAPVLTYLGRLTADKGVHRFLDAVEELAVHRPVAALVGGVGPEQAAVQARLARPPLAGRVRYVGPIAEEEKPSFLAQSDIFVLPSTSDTSSLALLEAMASGRACVASDQGGLPAIVRDGATGRIAPIGSVGGLAAVLGELLDAPEERRRLGAAARQWVVETASLEAMARRFISLYRLLLTETDGGLGTGSASVARGGPLLPG